MAKRDQECKHVWVRIWLRSNDYKVRIICKKCFEFQNGRNSSKNKRKG